MKNEIGVYGLGVMGQSLALNLAGHHFRVAVYEKFDYISKTKSFLETRANGLPIEGYASVEEFVQSLETPRKILIMITAGSAVDNVLSELKPLLNKGDILLDCGNSYFLDTVRREETCSKDGFCFFGVGVSGGEKGALTGPSIMPGGNKEVYKAYVANYLETIAAHTADNRACCDYIGPNGAGHYVKMVHNGIEYADMELLCEAYALMKSLYAMSNEKMAEVFEEWNHGRLNSYLVEITANILRKKDDVTNESLVDKILDKAGQKGTGKWTAMESFTIGVAAPSIAESVYARCLSSIKNERVAASKNYCKKAVQVALDKKIFLEKLENALYVCKVLCYAQGFALLKSASEQYQWHLNLGNIALSWRQGCIIRAQFLEKIYEAFQQEPVLNNLLMAEGFKREIKSCIPDTRDISALAIKNGVYIPSMTSALQYFDGYTTKQMTMNLLQAQRDYFGAHTYQRIDQPEEMTFHTEWENK